jgi:hypothetical protein
MKPTKPKSTKSVSQASKSKAKSTAAKKPGKGGVAIDTVPLPEKPAVKTKPGKIAAKTTSGLGKATPAKAKGTKPRTRPAPKATATQEKPAGKTEHMGIIDTNTKGETVLTRQRAPQGQVKTSGKTDQAGIIFVSRVSPLNVSPTTKSAPRIIVVNGRNLKRVTSARVIGRKQPPKNAAILSANDGAIKLRAPSDMQEGSYQIQFYAGNEPVQVAKHITTFQVKEPPRTAPPYPAPKPIPQRKKDKQTSPVKSAALAPKQTAKTSTTMKTGQKPVSSGEQSKSGGTAESQTEKSGHKSSDSSQSDSGSSSQGDVTLYSNESDSSKTSSGPSQRGEQQATQSYTAKEVAVSSALSAEAANSGMSGSQLAKFVENMQGLGADEALKDPQTWEKVRKQGTEKVLSDTVRMQYGIPEGVSPGASAKDLLNDLGTIQQLGREDSASSDLWKDVASVRTGSMDSRDFFGKWNVGGQGTTSSRGQGSGGGTGDSTGGGEGSSGSQIPSSGMDSGGSVVGGLDSSGGPTSSSSRSGSNETGASGGTAAGGSAGTNESGPSSGGPGGAGGSTAKGDSVGEMNHYSVEINDDGSFSYGWSYYSNDGTQRHGTTECSGGVCTDTTYDDDGNVIGKGTYETDKGPPTETEGTTNVAAENNNEDDSSSDDSGSNDSSDDDESESDNSDDSGSDDSGDSDSSSEDDTMRAPGELYAREKRSFEDFIARNFTPEGTSTRAAPYINPAPDEISDSGGSGTGINPEKPSEADPIEDERSISGSGTGINPEKPSEADPIEDERSVYGGSGTGIKLKPIPVAVAETSGGDTSSGGNYPSSSGGYITPGGGSVALGGAAPSLGGGSMGPTEPWKCKRRLIRSSSGVCWCYCPRDTHPVTGAPIQQNVPCPLEAEEIGTEGGQAQTTVGPDQSLFGQSDELDCREYTDSEWESM